MLHQLDILNIFKTYQISLWKELGLIQKNIYKTIFAILLKFTNYYKRTRLITCNINTQ